MLPILAVLAVLLVGAGGFAYYQQTQNANGDDYPLLEA